ncbi:Aste57867_1202 [Aphanomyces stellatus]|uniref:Aste57867_1202 protein n=1 Tax=Aphanomyces stellatus TaxID=120398 RepID=A0A485K7Y9_9STRA|nr:hypothetical protein As57867_001201 [Aphanomyces stellatus]VFT78422.1 Aste57867_1202 [Aphanomyces stellatus]
MATAAASAQAAVQKLLLSHMGMGPKFTYRTLFSSPEFESLQPKQALLHHACTTCCAAVVQEVLLFLSHTLSDALFHQELRLGTNAFALDHWANYLRQQQLINQGSTYVSLQDYPLIALFRGVGRHTDMAMEIFELILHEPNWPLALDWASEAQKLFERTRQPAWLQTQLQHYVQLQLLLRETEARDGTLAPPPQTRATQADKHKRSTGPGLNWRKKFIALDGSILTMRSHEPEKAAKSTFLPTREKEIRLTKDTVVVKRLHTSSTHAKQLARPFCLEIQDPDGHTTLLLDMWSQDAQNEWLAALEANIKRLSLDAIWLTRPTVNNMTLAQFVRYCLVYPDTKSHPAPTAATGEDGFLPWESARVRHLSDTFGIDSTRLLYLSILTCGQAQQWDALAALTRPGKVKRLFTSQPQSTIGFGAFVDVAVAFHAPRETIDMYAALFAKQTKGWGSLHTS